MSDKAIPIGQDFLDLIWTQDDALERATDERIAQLGTKAPKCLEALGTALSHLDRLSSCFYGCAGGDHVIEYLTGRVCSHARTVIRLMRFGFYDEALSLVRSIGEMANLARLFDADSAELPSWKAATEKERKTRYGPAAVRKRLEDLDLELTLDKDWYGLLCETVAHPTPTTKPNMFNPIGVPMSAPHLQDEGILACMNELGRVLCFYLVPTLNLLEIGKEKKLIALEEVRSLAENLGGVTLDALPELWRHRFAAATRH